MGFRAAAELTLSTRCWRSRASASQQPNQLFCFTAALRACLSCSSFARWARYLTGVGRFAALVGATGCC